jgi:lipid II:glycine glycyltransferase (peptidoglycan interpeptide bridge formation enzyme)
MRQLEPMDSQTWQEVLLRLPQPHILQTWEWGQIKRQNAWTPQFYIWGDQASPRAAAMLLTRQMRVLPGLSLKVIYCPKGPTLDWADQALAESVLADLEAHARGEKAIFIKIDPDIVLSTGQPGTDAEARTETGTAVQGMLGRRVWQYSTDQIQFRNTLVLDLSASEDELLAAMKQKTRYNIRLAQRRGVTVREAGLEELPQIYTMYAATAVRDDFVIRHEAYYLELWQRFYTAGMARFLIAEFEGEPVAALVMLHFAGVARYFYGMSTEKARSHMPTYLLQWEAIRLAKSLGCQTYDFWGAPEVLDESDSLWGVYRFKEGFNGLFMRTLGAWDYASRPWVYRLYTSLLPRLLDLMRKRGKDANRQRSIEV